jgi:hypothetical protein
MVNNDAEPTIVRTEMMRLDPNMAASVSSDVRQAYSVTLGASPPDKMDWETLR